MMRPPPKIRRAIKSASRASSTDAAALATSARRPTPPTTWLRLRLSRANAASSVAAVRALAASTSSGLGTRKINPPPRSITTSSLPPRPAQHVAGNFADLGAALGRNALIEPFGFDDDADVVGRKSDPTRRPHRRAPRTDRRMRGKGAVPRTNAGARDCRSSREPAPRRSRLRTGARKRCAHRLRPISSASRASSRPRERQASVPRRPAPRSLPLRRPAFRRAGRNRAPKQARFAIRHR